MTAFNTKANDSIRSELFYKEPFHARSPTLCACRAHDKRDQLITNADGSVDLYFGPKPPAGKEANWMQTIAGKGWFVVFRLYGPLEPWIDKTWRPGEFELVS